MSGADEVETHFRAAVCGPPSRLENWKLYWLQTPHCRNLNQSPGTGIQQAVEP